MVEKKRSTFKEMLLLHLHIPCVSCDQNINFHCNIRRNLQAEVKRGKTRADAPWCMACKEVWSGEWDYKDGKYQKLEEK